MAAEKKFDLSKVRNIGVIAHIDAGKTTTTEHMLFYAGAHQLGTVDKGTTTTDHDHEEQERGITIYSACVPLQWKDCTVNLIDTPGHVDFTAEVERSLRVLDGAVVVFDAQKGVEAQSETVWRQADKYNVPRLVFINKMDVVGANFANAVEDVVERLEGHPVALTLPIGSGSPKDSHTPFKGIIDLIQMKALYFDAAVYGRTFRTEDIPAEQLAEAQSWRERLFDVLTQHDDGDLITSAVLEGSEVSADNVHKLLREQTIKGLVHPVLCGSGREHIGIQPLMDAVTRYLPSPLDRPPVEGTVPKKPDKKEKRKPDPKEPFCALVFKVVADKSADIFFLRIYSGVLKPQSRPFNPGRDIKELVSKIYHIHADPKRGREEVPQGNTGDIVALLGLRDSITGDTLCDLQHPILLEPIRFAEAVVSQSVEPESSADKDKLVDTLNALKREDPTFTWGVNKDTGETMMNGMGVLHLEIKKHRMERDFNLKVKVRQPRVSYRETIRKRVRVEGEGNALASTANLFAKVIVEVEPNPDEAAVVVRSQVPDEKLPPEFVAAAERGIKNALQSGEVGFPVINVRATLLDGQLDPALSTEAAFEAAGANAIHKAIRENVKLLEPWMRLEVTVPDEYMGSVTGDLSARRAEIDHIHSRGKLFVVEARVPLAKMFDYSDKIRSLTQGRAGWSMEPRDYAPAPDEVLRSFLHPDENY